MISMESFWMGRDKKYPLEFTEEIESNGVETVAAINPLLQQFENDTGIKMERVASGWRPKEVNENTANAADHSRHLTAEAMDVRDTPNRDVARWVATHQHALIEAGLYCERFEWTGSDTDPEGNWVHFSKFPPKSGHRFYIPSAAPARCKRLPEQDENC